MKKNKPSDVMKLYKAVKEYIESRGGKAVMAGGVEAQEWPGDRVYNYYLAIKIMGIKPEPQPDDIG